MFAFSIGGEEGGAFGFEEYFGLSYGGGGLHFYVAAPAVDGLFFGFLLLGLSERGAVGFRFLGDFHLFLRRFFLAGEHFEAGPHDLLFYYLISNLGGDQLQTLSACVQNKNSPRLRRPSPLPSSGLVIALLFITPGSI